MAITIDPFKSSYKDDFKAKLFLEEYASHIDSLSSLENIESDFDRDQQEKTSQILGGRDTNYKVDDEVLLKRSLDDLKRSHKWELEAMKREKNYARTPYSDRITEELAENSKQYLLRMCELCKEKILFIYTVKNKIITTYNNGYVCFADRFLDPSNKNKVFKIDFYLYCADKIFEGALRFAKNYLNIPMDNIEARNLINGEYRKFLIQLKTIMDEFNGYSERDQKSDVNRPDNEAMPPPYANAPVECCDYGTCACIERTFSSYWRETLFGKNKDFKETRCVPFDIFVEKFRSSKKVTSKLIDEISDYVGDASEKLLKITSKIDKINGDTRKGKEAITEVRGIFRKLDFLNMYFLKNLFDLCDKIFDSLNKTEIMHRK